MKKLNMSFKDAIAYVRKSRPSVLPNLGFERQLKKYEEALKRASKSSSHSRRN
jgi:protein-tyrosine phosphatase